MTLFLSRTFTRRLRQHPFRAPSQMLSSSEDALSDVELIGPFSEPEALSAPRNLSVTILVNRLLRWRCPSAISRFVVTVIIDAFNHQSRRRLAHVVCELSEVIAPRVTHGYASSAVSRVAMVGCVVAASLGVIPDSVKRCSTFTVCGVGVSSAFSAETSAASTDSAFKIPRTDDRDCAAVASAQPVRSSSRIVCSAKHRPSMESAVGKVYQRWHT